MIPIPFAPGYFVTETGEVWSEMRGAPRRLKQFKDSDGYWRVGLSVGGRSYQKGVHVIMCVVFHGPPPSTSMEARHLDGVKTNNLPSNLAWGTRKQNAEDMMRHGGHRAQTKPESYADVGRKISESQRRAWLTRESMAGEASPSAKLDNVKVTFIRERSAMGERHSDIAARVGVSRSTVSLVLQGKTWKGVGT